MKEFNKNTPFSNLLKGYIKQEGNVDFTKLYAIIVENSYNTTFGNDFYYNLYTFILKPTPKIEYYQELSDLSGECDSVSAYKTFNLEDKKHAKMLDNLKLIDFSTWNENANYDLICSSSKHEIYYTFIDENGNFNTVVWVNSGKVYNFNGQYFLNEVLSHVDNVSKINLKLKPKRKKFKLFNFFNFKK